MEFRPGYAIAYAVLAVAIPIIVYIVFRAISVDRLRAFLIAALAMLLFVSLAGCVKAPAPEVSTETREHYEFGPYSVTVIQLENGTPCALFYGNGTTATAISCGWKADPIIYQAAP